MALKQRIYELVANKEQASSQTTGSFGLARDNLVRV
jgi:hypothetical protein